MPLIDALIKEQAEFALLEDTKSPAPLHDLFTEAYEHIIAYEPSQLKAAFERIEKLSGQGFHLCGYVAYEAGYHFIEKPIAAKPSHDILLYFIAFKNKHSYRPNLYQNGTNDTVALYDFRLSQDQSDYIKTIDKIKNYIQSGDSYQVNYTLKYDFSFTGDILSLYRQIQQNQPAEYGALLHFSQQKILSFSPELFVKKSGNIITSQPMKGTAPRGANIEEDKEIIAAMKADEKTLAENLMIVDLMRNDLSRLCEIGSVNVENLFEVKSYKSLHQMVSTITGLLKPHMGLYDIFRNIFPCGSITGAPKIRTMEIIHELEKKPRNIYTGAIGYLSPCEDFCFNIPIRSLLITGKNKAEMGIGSGIVFDSQANAEYEECLLKAQFVKNTNRHFHLFETMRYQNGHIPLLRYHLERLQKSADFFGFIYPAQNIARKIESHIKSLHDTTGVKLCLYHNGEVHISNKDFQKSRRPFKLTISPHRVDKHDIWLYHKTSRRSFYEKAYQQAQEQGYDEVIFMNQDDEITEASRHNIIIESKGKLYTPPVSCGLLPGVFRQKLWQEHKIEEKILTFKDLQSAQAIYLSNGLKYLQKASL